MRREDDDTFCVPARGLDASSGLQFSYVYVEDVDDADLDWIARNMPEELPRLIDEALARDHAERCVADVVTLHNGEPRHEVVIECELEIGFAAAE